MARILLIDDDNNIRLMVKLALQEKKHSIESTANGADGLAKFGEAADWDLVLLDNSLPDMPALSVLRSIIERKKHPRIVVMVCRDPVETSDGMKQAGASDILYKPFSIDTLLRTVDGSTTRRMSFSTAQAATSDTDSEHDETTGLAFSSTTVNGFRIRYHPGSALKAHCETLFSFTVCGTDMRPKPCTILLPGYLPELIKAYSLQENFLGNERFWEAMCEEVLSQYLWQHGDIPTDGVLRIEELTDDIRRWVSAVVGATV